MIQQGTNKQKTTRAKTTNKQKTTRAKTEQSYPGSTRTLLLKEMLCGSPPHTCLLIVQVVCHYWHLVIRLTIIPDYLLLCQRE